MRVEQFVLNEARNVVLTAYIQETGGTYRKLVRRPGILVIPGGAYRYVSRREGDPVASCFLQAGYQVMILEYSVGEFAAWPNPLEDYEQAMECVSAHAEEWHLVMDRFAVIGFSAGGHLAGAAATMAMHRPAAAILGYALLTDEIQRYLDAPSPAEKVTPDCCPCFLFASRTDPSVSVRNTLAFTNALEAAGVPYETHIYSHGPHGFSTGAGQIQDQAVMCRRAFAWSGDALSWLEDVMGGMNDGEMTPPVLSAVSPE